MRSSQGLVFGPLWFLIFINDLHKVTKYLDPIMFANKTNKLSLNEKKKYVLFHKVSMYDSLPLQLRTMTFDNIEILSKLKEKILSDF